MDLRERERRCVRVSLCQTTDCVFEVRPSFYRLPLLSSLPLMLLQFQNVYAFLRFTSTLVAVLNLLFDRLFIISCPMQTDINSIVNVNVFTCITYLEDAHLFSITDILKQAKQKQNNTNELLHHAATPSPHPQTPQGMDQTRTHTFRT